MKSIALFSSLFLIGCSHVVTQKVAMELPFSPELVEQIQITADRSPASLSTDDVEGKSPRRVYFSALYHQYLTMGHHLKLDSDVTFCPQFHHDKVETDSSLKPEVSVYRRSSVTGSEKNYFPELAFTKSFSLKDHYQTIREEIGTLCEEGVSDNYYKFDNLVTHYASKKSFHHRPDSMRAILKIPVFANYYLLKMLQPHHALTFIHPEERKVITMTQTHWFEKYVNEAHRMRAALIKNHMVKR